MNSEISFPQNLTDFLLYIKETTETYWSKLPPEEMIHGAKWLPLSDEQIDGFEQKYSIRFGEEHREFLRVLHTIDKHYEEEIFPDSSEGHVETEEEKVQREQLRPSYLHPSYRPSHFYNWITEKEWIESRLAWIEFMFIGDMLSVNKSWLRSWGAKPASDEEKINIFRNWYQQAPLLLPIKAHTYLMSDGGSGLRPVMSAIGFDTIISAWSLRHFLLMEFGMELGLKTAAFDDEGNPEGYDLVEGIPELDELMLIRLDETDIPFWKEVLTYYNHPDHEGWQGFKVPWSKP